MLSILSSLVSGIIGPLTSMISSIYTSKSNVTIAECQVNGAVDISLVQAQVQIAALNASLLQNKWMIRLQVAFGAPLAVYYGKCIIWDKVLQDWTHGHTDILQGDISTYSLWIVGFLFLHSAIANWVRK